MPKNVTWEEYENTILQKDFKIIELRLELEALKTYVKNLEKMLHINDNIPF